MVGSKIKGARAEVCLCANGISKMRCFRVLSLIVQSKEVNHGKQREHQSITSKQNTLEESQPILT